MKRGVVGVTGVAAVAAAYALVVLPALIQLGSLAGLLGMLPVIAAALRFGLRGSLPVFALVVLSDVPIYALAGHDFLTWKTLLIAFGCGLLAAALGRLRDIDLERRRLSERHEQERRRSEHEAQKASESLYRAEEALRESEAKSAFLATMSHELRTPLNSVLGFAQLLASGEFGSLNERQGRYVDNIRVSGRHLLDLVNDVLDVVEVQGGNMHVRLEPVDLREAITDALTRLRSKAEAKGIRIELERSPALSARADRDRLAQVLSNLLANAIKFTGPGGQVTVTLASEDGRVSVTVIDTGIGIPPEDQSRIFDDFVQVESGRTRREEGTGLGLALTRHLVNLMGGGISLVSQPGMGSAFTVSLPLAAYDHATSTRDQTSVASRLSG